MRMRRGSAIIPDFRAGWRACTERRAQYEPRSLK
jgi:hypothetical protein